MNNPISDKKRSDRVLRGGSWFDNPLFARTSYRDAYSGTARSIALGFRVVRNA